MAKKTIKDLEDQLNRVRFLYNSYFDEVQKLREELENTRNNIGVVTVDEYKRLQKELEQEKLKSKVEFERAMRWREKYYDFVKKNKEGEI